MRPNVCCELKPQMCPCDYTTAWADRDWEQNSQTMNESRSSVSQHGTEKKKVQNYKDIRLVQERGSLHESRFSSVKWFTVNETTSSWNLFWKRTTRASEMGRKWLLKVMRPFNWTDRGWSSHVALLSLHRKSELTGVKQKDAGLLTESSPPCCFTLYNLLITSHPTGAALPAGMHI